MYFCNAECVIFSSGSVCSCHDIAEIFLMLVLNTNQSMSGSKSVQVCLYMYCSSEFSYQDRNMQNEKY